MKRYIVLVQEPWIINNRICGLPKRGLIFSDSKEKLRSCVIVSPDIKAWPLSAFTDADCLIYKMARRRSDIRVSIYAR
jgi:hypothetical protein